MKCYREGKEFKPVYIVLETQEECEELFQYLYQGPSLATKITKAIYEKLAWIKKND